MLTFNEVHAKIKHFLLESALINVRHLSQLEVCKSKISTHRNLYHLLYTFTHI